MKHQIEIELTESDVLAACQTSMITMFESSYFNACKVWDCCKSLGIEYMENTKVGNFLNQYHCIDFFKIENSQLEKLKKICYSLVGMEVPTAYPTPEIIADELILNGFQRKEFKPELQYHDFEIVPNPAF